MRLFAKVLLALGAFLTGWFTLGAQIFAKLIPAIYAWMSRAISGGLDMLAWGAQEDFTPSTFKAWLKYTAVVIGAGMIGGAIIGGIVLAYGTALALILWGINKEGDQLPELF